MKNIKTWFGLVLCLLLMQKVSAQRLTLNFQQAEQTGREDPFVVIRYFDSELSRYVTDYQLIRNKTKIVIDLELKRLTELHISSKNYSNTDDFDLLLGPGDALEISVNQSVNCNRPVCDRAYYFLRYSFAGSAAEINSRYAYFHYANDHRDKRYNLSSSVYLPSRRAQRRHESDYSNFLLNHVDTVMQARMASIKTIFKGRKFRHLRKRLRDNERYDALELLNVSLFSAGRIPRKNELSEAGFNRLIITYHKLESKDPMLPSFVKFTSRYSNQSLQTAERMGYRKNYTALADSLLRIGEFNCRPSLQSLYRKALAAMGTEQTPTFWTVLNDQNVPLETQQVLEHDFFLMRTQLMYSDLVWQYMDTVDAQDLPIEMKFHLSKQFAIEQLVGWQFEQFKTTFIPEGALQAFSRYSMAMQTPWQIINQRLRAEFSDIRDEISKHGGHPFKTLGTDKAYFELLDSLQGKYIIQGFLTDRNANSLKRTLLSFKAMKETFKDKDVALFLLTPMQNSESGAKELKEISALARELDMIDDIYLASGTLSFWVDVYFEYNLIGNFKLLDPTGSGMRMITPRMPEYGSDPNDLFILPHRLDSAGNKHLPEALGGRIIYAHRPAEETDNEAMFDAEGDDVMMEIAVEEIMMEDYNVAVPHFEDVSPSAVKQEKPSPRPAWTILDSLPALERKSSIAELLDSAIQQNRYSALVDPQWLENSFSNKGGWYFVKHYDIGFGTDDVVYLSKRKSKKLLVNRCWVYAKDTLFVCKNNGEIISEHPMHYDRDLLQISVTTGDTIERYRIRSASEGMIILEKLK